jgi:hypothetical protein
MWSADAALRIRRHLPSVRLVAILRDPAERAFSAWRMYRRQLADDAQLYRRLIPKRYGREQIAASGPHTTDEMADFWTCVQRDARRADEGRPSAWGLLELGQYGPQLRR